MDLEILDKITIRYIKKSDINTLFEIGKENFSEIYDVSELECLKDELKDAFKNNARYIILEYNKDILGFGGFYESFMDDGLYEIVWINIKKEFRHYKIGTFLIKSIINEITKNNSVKNDITILLSCQNHLIDFYKQCGFNVLLHKASNKEVIMGISILRNNLN